MLSFGLREGGVGCGSGIGDKVYGADVAAVVVPDASEVGLAGDNPVLFEVVEAVDEAQNDALKRPEQGIADFRYAISDF